MKIISGLASIDIHPKIHGKPIGSRAGAAVHELTKSLRMSRSTTPTIRCMGLLSEAQVFLYFTGNQNHISHEKAPYDRHTPVPGIRVLQER
jgi:hypothetical protein